MRVVIASISAFLLLAGTCAAAAERPRLATAFVDAGLVVRGTHFVGGERVRVTAGTGSGAVSRRVRASATGRFRVTFAEAAGHPCSTGLTLVRAVGSRGSRAAVKLPAPLCPPTLERAP